MTTRPPAPSPLRTVPVQARSRQTVATILDAASALLREGGPEALTTSALATRTGLHVRNVYRYFPNREAVVAALSERLNARIEAAIDELATQLQTEDLREGLRRVVGAVLQIASAEPALAQLRAALRGSPALQAMELASDRRVAHGIARLLARRGGPARRKDLAARAFVLVTAVGAVLDRSLLARGSERALLVREAETLGLGYLAQLAPPQPPSLQPPRRTRRASP